MMGRTRILAAASGIALALGGATAAGAQGFGLGADGNWYARGFGGATWPQEDSTGVRGAGAANQDFDLDYDTGFTLGAAFGKDFTPNFALELEYAYRQADLKGDVDGDTRANAVMLNALYKMGGLGPNAAWKPYFGGGLGWTNLQVDIDDVGEFERDSALGYQVMAGVGYEVAPQWTLLGEVRWFGTDSGDAGGPDGSFIDTKFETIDLLVGASYSF